MAVNAGPYVSWGLYKAKNLPLAFARWWIDGPAAEAPVTGGGFTIVALRRLTTAMAHVITKGVAIGRLARVKADRVVRVTWIGLNYRSRSRR
jgi:hypothetical protein